MLRIINLYKNEGAYKQLFVGQVDRVNIVQVSDTGTEHYQQGATAPDVNDMASITMTKDIPQANTTINDKNNVLDFRLNGSYVSVTLANGTYTRARDANMAAKMVEHLKHKLMTNVSESVLAQANQLPNRLLNLLLT